MPVWGGHGVHDKTPVVPRAVGLGVAPQARLQEVQLIVEELLQLIRASGKCIFIYDVLKAV